MIVDKIDIDDNEKSIDDDNKDIDVNSISNKSKRKIEKVNI